MPPARAPRTFSTPRPSAARPRSAAPTWAGSPSGAKADVVIINLRSTRYGPARDPINALVEYGSGADVETVIVDGEVVD